MKAEQTFKYNFNEDGNDRYYTVKFKFFAGRMGTMEDPPSDDEVEIYSVYDESGTEVIVDDEDELLLKIEQDILQNGLSSYDHYYDEII